MSTENEPEIVEPVENLENGFYEEPTVVPEAHPETDGPQARETILPIMMRKGGDLVQLGDGILDAETGVMMVSFNTPAGRDITNFMGSGMLESISFAGQIRRSDLSNIFGG